MRNCRIDTILVIDRSGLPLLTQAFNPKGKEMDPMLVSGFITAIASFSQDLVAEHRSIFQINYGAR